MFHEDGVEGENLSEPRKKVTKVTFNENTNISEEKLDLKRKRKVQICWNHSVLGYSTGKCERQHPEKVCYQYRDRGYCRYGDESIFKHAVINDSSTRISLFSGNFNRLKEQQWTPQRAPESDWRMSTASLGNVIRKGESLLPSSTYIEPYRPREGRPSPVHHWDGRSARGRESDR